MRIAFLLAVLMVSLFYTYTAFADLGFLSRTGRLGPGFFPRIIGIALVACCLASLWPDFRKMQTDEVQSSYWQTLFLIVALTGGFVLSLTILGGPLAMALFLMVTLSYLNRGRHGLNLAVAVLMPASIYFLFDVWLNASMPEGILPLPI